MGLFRRKAEMIDAADALPGRDVAAELRAARGKGRGFRFTVLCG